MQENMTSDILTRVCTKYNMTSRTTVIRSAKNLHKTYALVRSFRPGPAEAAEGLVQEDGTAYLWEGICNEIRQT